MEKKFDAVQFQRKVREELSKEYSTTPDVFVRELQEKYRYLQRQKIEKHSK
ncbi:MAG: hypothetical protein J7J51_03590 [Candidatus Omnitrophica bacterium]|nr:hypothetical protein [Candidatus Omnitrophota bacterium]